MARREPNKVGLVVMEMFAYILQNALDCELLRKRRTGVNVRWREQEEGDCESVIHAYGEPLTITNY